MQQGRRGRLARASPVAMVAVVALAGSSLAATGDLTPKGCIDHPEGGDTCAETTGGLDFAISVAVSPDGKSVYVAGSGDSAIVGFERTANGALIPQGCIDDVTTGQCEDQAAGLSGAESVAVSPDGKSVYAVGFADDAVVHLKRNRTTGELTPRGCIEDGGQDECDEETAGLDGPESVAVSPDGDSVYVATGTDDAVVRFKRNQTNGALTPKGCIEDTGQDECGAETEGLDLMRSVTVSPDGRSVYAAGAGDDAIVRFTRRTTGALVPKGCVEDAGQDECADEAAGLDFPTSVTVSPDGESVYVAGSADGAVVTFRRNQTSGALADRGCIEDVGLGGCDEETAGLDGARTVAVSADGRSLYVASESDAAVVAFKRTLANGSLTPRGCVEDIDQNECDEETAGLADTFSVAVSPDGKSVYAIGTDDDAIVRFKRER